MGVSSFSEVLNALDCMYVFLTGPAKDTFVVGATVKKGAEDGQNKAYCQVRHTTLSLTVIHQSQPEKPMTLGLSVHNTRLKGQTEEGYSHRVETSYQLPNGV